MLNMLIYKLNNRISLVLILLALIAVCAVPFPTLIGYMSVNGELDDASARLKRLTELSNELRSKENAISSNLRKIYVSLERRFEGLENALLLRNMIIKIAKANEIKIESCTFNDAQKLNSGDNVRSSLKKDIYTVNFEMRGVALLADILLFIYVLEDLDISIRMTSFSTFQNKDERTKYTFTLALKGFYVVDVNSAEKEG
jgi:hypothetical protein